MKLKCNVPNQDSIWKKIFAFLLVFLTISLLIFDNLSKFNNNHLLNQSTNFSFSKVERISENTAKIYYGDSSDIIFEKCINNNKGFEYKIFDAITGKKLCSFNSQSNINIDECDFDFEVNANICAAVWAVTRAIVFGGDPVQAVIASFAGVGGLANGVLITIVDLIISDGILATPAILGLLSGTEALAAFYRYFYMFHTKFAQK